MKTTKPILTALLAIGVVITSILIPYYGEAIGVSIAIAGAGGIILSLLFDVRSPFKILPREGEMDWELYLGLCLGGVLATLNSYLQIVTQVDPLFCSTILGLTVAIGLDWLQTKSPIVWTSAMAIVCVAAGLGLIYFGLSPYIGIPLIVGLILHIIT